MWMVHATPVRWQLLLIRLDDDNRPPSDTQIMLQTQPSCCDSQHNATRKGSSRHGALRLLDGDGGEEIQNHDFWIFKRF